MFFKCPDQFKALVQDETVCKSVKNVSFKISHSSIFFYCDSAKTIKRSVSTEQLEDCRKRRPQMT